MNGSSVINIIVIGHVDVGKSTTCGNMMCLSGKINENEIASLKRHAAGNGMESWYLAYVMDADKGEMEKGKTVELGYASFNINSITVNLLDAPGHKNYIPNLIHGITQADVGMLIVSAKKNEFMAGIKNGQTLEHVQLLRAHGITQLIVCVNKMDDATINWSYEVYEKIISFLDSIFVTKYHLSKVHYVPISGLHGDNIDKKKTHLMKSDGITVPVDKSLFDVIASTTISRNVIADVSFVVTYFVTQNKTNCEILCKVIGSVNIGTPLYVIGSTLEHEVLSVADVTGNALGTISNGSCVKIKLSGECSDEYPILTNVKDQKLIYNTSELIIEVTFMSMANNDNGLILSEGFSCVAHIHHRGVNVTVQSILSAKKHNAENEQKLPKWILAKQDDRVIMRVKTSQRVQCSTLSICEFFSHITLRNGEQTLAVGNVIKLKPV